MEELDQGCLHPLPETDMYRPGFEPQTSCTTGGHSSKELSQQLINMYILSRYNIIDTPAPGANSPCPLTPAAAKTPCPQAAAAAKTPCPQAAAAAKTFYYLNVRYCC
jgi:hypothetical protein